MRALAMLAQGGTPEQQYEFGEFIVLGFLPLVLPVVVIAIVLAMWIHPARREEPSPEQVTSKDDLRWFVSGCLFFVAFGVSACYGLFAASVLFQ